MSVKARSLPLAVTSVLTNGSVHVETGVNALVHPARVLVVADAQGILYAAARLLPRNGYPVSTVFEEGHVVANVLAHADAHNLMLVSQRMTSAFCLPRLFERLRQVGYAGHITFCTRELTAEISAAFEAVSVDRCLQPPAEAQATLLQVVEWLQGPAALSGPALSVLEV